MKHGFRAAAGVIAGVWLSMTAGWPVHAHGGSAVQADSLRKEAIVATHASGTFEVKLAPQPLEENAEGTFGRMSIDKQFHGDIEGTSKGQMLTAGTSVKDSGVYVAVERITGKLHGKSGSFVVQHSGVMTRGAPQLTITVVPDSGTGELVGLAGTMTIRIADGKHFYDFEYTKE
jgi:Protein of unknown function (DUF3224)